MKEHIKYPKYLFNGWNKSLLKPRFFKPSLWIYMIEFNKDKYIINYKSYRYDKFIELDI